jgi:Tol biopolymer transport system component
MHAPIYRNIYSVTSDGGREEQLTDDNQSFGAVLSPDGSKIAFIHLKSDSCEDCFYPPEYELYVMKADGTDADSVAAIDGPVGVSWSPDSKMLAYGGLPVSRNPQMNSLPEWAIQMEVLQALESPLYLLQLGSGASPQKLSDKTINPFQWSPDGKWIAFGCLGPSTGRESRSRICIRETGQQAALRMLPENASLLHFSWSPDSTNLAYFGFNKKTYTLFVVGTDASVPRPLTELKGVPEDSPQWSLDGKQILLSGIENKRSVIFTINVDGSGKTRLTEPKLNASHPMWSPDGKQVVFTAVVHDKPQVHLMNADGSQVRALTHNGKLGCRNVAWLEGSSLLLLSCGQPSNFPYQAITKENFYLLDAGNSVDRPRPFIGGSAVGISFAAISAPRRNSAR